MIYALLYLAVGALITWRDVRWLTGKRTPPAHMKQYVEETRDLFHMRPDVVGPVFIVSTLLLWLPLYIYGIFHYLYEGDDSYD